MWMLLADFDLTRKIVAPARPADEPLRWMLRNPRAMRITRQSDNLWLRILDLPRALEARSYESTADLTFAINADTMCPHNAGVLRCLVRYRGRCTRG
jgi:predicted acetyltransferase